MQALLLHTKAGQYTRSKYIGNEFMTGSCDVARVAVSTLKFIIFP